MTLNEFLDMWTRANRMVVVCDTRYCDDMFDIVDDLNENKKHIQDIKEYIEFAIVPYYTQWRAKHYLSSEYSDARVDEFFIGDCYVIVWVEKEEQK